MRLETIYKEWGKRFPRDGYKDTPVFGTGNPGAEILLLGEAPGGEEVEAGMPFVGRAGKNLDAFLAYLALPRESVYITNVVKFRPYTLGKTGRKVNRTPNKKEIAVCRACLLQELEVVRPKLIVTLGNTALNAVIPQSLAIGTMHGRVLQSRMGTDVFALYHPASIIYNRNLRGTYFADLDLLKAYLRQTFFCRMR